MARHSRRRGPTADFELGAAFSPIPGLSVTRTWDAGLIYAAAAAAYTNASPGPTNASLRLLIDDTPYPTITAQQFVNNGANATLHFAALISITPGNHTIALQATGAAAAGDTITAGGTEFLLLQLPPWDDELDLVIL